MPDTAQRAAAVAIAALLLLGGLAAAGGLLVGSPEADGSEAARVNVAVVAPGPETVFWDAVTAADATAFGALAAAARAGGFEVETREYPGMGLYVVAIAGHEARGTSGWVFEVERDGRVLFGDRASDRFAVADGERVTWRWSDAPPSG